MALITCAEPECGKRFSDTLTQCPECGCPAPTTSPAHQTASSKPAQTKDWWLRNTDQEIPPPQSSATSPQHTFGRVAPSLDTLASPQPPSNNQSVKENEKKNTSVWQYIGIAGAMVVFFAYRSGTFAKIGYVGAIAAIIILLPLCILAGYFYRWHDKWEDRRQQERERREQEKEQERLRRTQERLKRGGLAALWERICQIAGVIWRIIYKGTVLLVILLIVVGIIESMIKR